MLIRFVNLCKTLFKNIGRWLKGYSVTLVAHLSLGYTFKSPIIFVLQVIVTQIGVVTLMIENQLVDSMHTFVPNLSLSLQRSSMLPQDQAQRLSIEVWPL